MLGELYVFRCRICEKLIKREALFFGVWNGDPSCCKECNDRAELQESKASGELIETERAIIKIKDLLDDAKEKEAIRILTEEYNRIQKEKGPYHPFC